MDTHLACSKRPPRWCVGSGCRHGGSRLCSSAPSAGLIEAARTVRSGRARVPTPERLHRRALYIPPERRTERTAGGPTGGGAVVACRCLPRRRRPAASRRRRSRAPRPSRGRRRRLRRRSRRRRHQVRPLMRLVRMPTLGSPQSLDAADLYSSAFRSCRGLVVEPAEGAGPLGGGGGGGGAAGAPRPHHHAGRPGHARRRARPHPGAAAEPPRGEDPKGRAGAGRVGGVPRAALPHARHRYAQLLHVNPERAPRRFPSVCAGVLLRPVQVPHRVSTRAYVNP